MQINLKPKKIKDVFNGYHDNGEEGVFAYGGNLTVRPPYQREFIYGAKEEESVMHTVLSDFPLNVMYWVKTSDSDDSTPTFEVLDGQQRTLSIMRFLDHKYDIDYKGNRYYVDSLPDEAYDRLMNYELMVYECEGTTEEKLDWFRVVNIAGKPLNNQELLNSVHTGPWLTDAKRHFCKRGCAAYLLGSKYVNGDPIRQDLLALALKWIVDAKKPQFKDESAYMSYHRYDSNSDELWGYFQDVIHWVEKLFPTYDKSMDGLDWGLWYNTYHNRTYSPTELDKKAIQLREDEDVQKKGGIYHYLLAEDDPFRERFLNIRAFKKSDMVSAYNRQKGICPICHQHYEITEMEADHIIPWSQGGHTTPDNCQMLCKSCNRKKSNK